MRGNGGAGSGPRRCAVALEAAGKLPRQLRRDSPRTLAAYGAALPIVQTHPPRVGRAHGTSPARPDGRRAEGVPLIR